ncbi:MAG TPA: metal-sulfur cluster assembly factor [Elusimicrobiota bacterium]|nr:metal-sulfur cluster assembly factor [Elusimicrobiota bacterium]
MSTQAASPLTFRQIGAALQPVQDPEIHMSIVDLGLVYGAEIGRTDKGLSVKVRMSLTSPACPYGPMLLASTHSAIARLPGVKDVDVDLVFNPTWDPRTMATEDAKEQLGLY